MKRFSGFTLIELLVVLGIIGILAAALLATINPVAQLQKSHDARRKADLESIQRGLALYNQDYGRFPATIPAGGSSWSPYMSVVPKDPQSPTDKYVYYSSNADGYQSYYLYAHLERGKYDPNACNKGLACQSLSGSGFPSTTACGGLCNYGVSSSNVSP